MWMEYKLTSPSLLSLQIVSNILTIINCTERPCVWTFVCISKWDRFLKVELLGQTHEHSEGMDL